MKQIISRLLYDVKKNWVGLTAVAVCLILFSAFRKEVCPSQILFGLPCPGCGLTRAGILLLSGHFIKAFQMHPFIYVFLFGLLYVGFWRYVKMEKEIPYGIPLLIFVVTAMTVFFVYRMLHYFPNVEPMMVSKHTPILDVRESVSLFFQRHVNFKILFWSV